MVEALERIWQGLLDLTSKIVIPDWNSVVGLIPILLVIGVVGPILTLVILFWVIYIARRPRTRIRFAEGATAAPLGEDGKPVFPRGEPYCFRDGLIYPFGTHECDVCHDELAVLCPKCGVGRSAVQDTCGNCGLVLRIEPRLRALAPVGPPPGGAAAA